MKSGSTLSPSVLETASREAGTGADVSGRNARVLNAHVVEPRNSCIAAAMDFLSRKPFPQVGFRAAFAYALDGFRHRLRQFGVIRGFDVHSGFS
ncbi:hypothetical protein AGR8A_Cc60455 [Agrobacterium fabrum str. J-07]|nr:hypothetical protein AGR8A_Cc60455 [Agrobacterium fabrum str. J-07]